MASHKFRANVAALITKDNLVLTFQRVDYPDVWQCAQGGVSIGESVEQAIWREVKEETGLTAVSLTLKAVYPEWICYEYINSDKNEEVLGQAQKWFWFELTGDDADIKIDNKEFGDWKWMTIDELIEIVPLFKRSVFEKLKNWIE